MTTLFSPFGISWVIRSSIRETLLGWHDYFFGRKRKKIWGVAPICFFFLIIWKERNKRLFWNVELSNQRLKVLFLCSLFSWSKLFIRERSMSLFDFIDWLGSV